MTAAATSTLPPPPGIPVSTVDPFSTAFFEDPHRLHEELREAGAVGADIELGKVAGCRPP